MTSTTIEAGKLRHVIQIVQPTLAQDSFGGWKIDTDSLVAEARARIEALSGRDLYAAQQKVSEVTHRITIRWQAGIKAKQNVWFDSREFQIEAVENPDEIHHMLVLLCIERDDSAREAAGGTSGTVPTPIAQPVIFAGDGLTNIFNLPYAPPHGIMLFWNGLFQIPPADYVLSGAQIAMTLTPKSGDPVIAFIL